MNECKTCNRELPLHMFRELPIKLGGNISMIAKQKYNEAVRSNKCLDCSEVEESAIWEGFYKTGEEAK